MSGSQKFIARNRAPRVQIEYDVELYGAEKKVQLPFVMGVMSDLSGKSEVAQGSLSDRKFLEVDIDNFDSRMKAMKPRAAFSVPNTLTGEGNLSVDLVFEKMSDFSPAAIASKVEPLRKLLEARTQLSNLMTYMDGKTGAEELIEKLVANPLQLKALALGGAKESDTNAAFAAIKAAAPEEETPKDNSTDILASMATAAPEPAAEDATAADALSAMAATAPADAAPDTSVEDALAGVAASAVEEGGPEDTTGAVLADMAEHAPDETVTDTKVEDLLSDMAEKAPEAEADTDQSTGILAGMASEAIEEEIEDEGSAAALASMAASATEAPDDIDTSAGILAELAEQKVDDIAPDTAVEEALAGLANTDLEEDEAVDDCAEILDGLANEAPAEEGEDDGLEGLLADVAGDVQEEETEDNAADVLEALANEPEPEDVNEDNDEELSELLAELAESADEEEDEDTDDDLATLLADVADDDSNVEEDDDEDGGLEDLLADVAGEVPEDESEHNDAEILAAIAEDPEVEDEIEEDDLSDSLVNMAEEASEANDDEEDGLDNLLADLADEDDDEDLAALLADVTDDSPEEDDDEELDDLLADIDDEESEDDDDSDIDALMAGLDDEDGEDDDDIDLDDLLGDDDDELSEETTGEDDMEDAASDAPKKSAFQPDFGSLSAADLQDADGTRRKFRIAVLGDFSGRGNKGELESGTALGKRKAFKLDFDTMEDVIERFHTTLTLPLGDDGSAVEVELNELDDLHPDELFESVELFNELNMLRRDLKSGRNLDKTIEQLKGWGGEFGSFKALSKKRSKGSAAPADLRLSEFQNLIGDSTPSAEASSTQDLISRIVGSHIVAAKDDGTEEMIAAVDRALSTAMSSVLHHPDFQTVEAAWRSIELLGRRVEASAELEVVVYDLSVEEFSADLAAQDDMSESGLFDMLVEKPRQDESAGPISAVIGLYTWEETPTHAELLARMARISAHMDAPFISAISTGFMSIKPEDRHPLVAKTWDALREMPEAKYLGLASPRFMLRMPYGKKTEPVDRFDYEEFNLKEGMRSMLMANPALLVAVLLAETKARQGGDMSLGSIMALDDMPFHYMSDQYGDQVALPCTERLLSVAGSADVIARGYMPVISVQGQNMVKLTSFQAVGGGELLGIWAGDAAKQMKSGKAQMLTGVGISSGAKQVGAPVKATPAAKGGGSGDGEDEDDLDIGQDDDDDDFDLDIGGDDDDDDDLNDLLAGFGDDDDEDDDEMDAELAALLGDL